MIIPSDLGDILVLVFADQVKSTSPISKINAEYFEGDDIL